ncbi:3-oxoacyl-[acyl-carrier-protein] synthase III C-terminal domain-containing protein [Lactiplantibacillus pentosus]|uniref:3-oxoacyl-[acyl-carrier-protein] synthase III C-terminal domain-containing protein n=1 Tax=Lactiplantibacillus pentosus TaxID=1589 RepID=UPI0021A84C9C|nr:3-oxoacyl-[acyl-carrier-protein] synthase III C-terminal domain-containing protein [Lactiplantibacillus pentosus]MCT3311233.1 3-oxoacyl-ACP synthase [Lactiplantibacillus pentosus]
MQNFGISSYGMKVPFLRLPVNETVGSWKNNSVDLINNKIGVIRRAVLASDEDVLTLSVAAVKDALNIDIDEVSGMVLGTSTAPDLLQSNANQIMSFLTDSKNYIGFDVQASENSGLCALLTGFGFVASHYCKHVCAIGADCLSRHIFPSELREPYMGAGAAAFLISTDKVIARYIDTASLNEHFPEQSRPEDERFIRVMAPLNSAVVQEGLVQQGSQAVRNLLKKNNLAIKDIDYFAFNQVGENTPKQIARFLGIQDKCIKDSKFASNTGDTGAASSLISLQMILDKAKPNQKIVLCGYGHSTGATAILLETTNELMEYRELRKGTIEKINDFQDINYVEAMKNEFKFVQPGIALSTFL